MQLHVIPVRQGMSQKELEGRLQSGWIKVGRQVMQTGSKIATPGQPNAVPLTECDVWVLPEPTIPMGAVAGAMVQVMTGGGDMPTLDAVCKLLFNLTAVQLAAKFGVPSAVTGELLKNDLQVM